MGEKKTLSGRIPPDTEERFEQYRQRRGINQTDAMRRLLEEGLDAVEEEQRLMEQQAESARESQEQDTVPENQTGTEKWCRSRFQTWLSGMLVTGSATLALWLSFGAALWYPGITPEQWLPTQVMAGVMFLGVVLFLTFGSGALVTGVLLKTGYARRIDQWQNSSPEQPGAT